MRKLSVSLFYLLFLLNFLSAENQNTEIIVSNITELNAVIASAEPGQTIVMKDGRWKDAVINFNSSATASANVTLKAQTPGKVFLTGKSRLTFSKPYLVVDGLVFKSGAIESGSVITFNSDYCRLTNTIIRNYNPVDFQKGYYWVYFTASHNRLDHCLFSGKSNMNPVVGNDDANSRYNKVDSCIIKDIPYVRKANGREIFRIWGYGHADETGDDGAYFTIEYNLFDHADGEGTEIISLKSNYNIVRHNTVIASRGGLVGRRGKFNTFEGNFILGENQDGTSGIRVAGANHRVINNYIANVSEDGMRLITGEYYEKSLTDNFGSKEKNLPMYLQVKDGYFAHNTILNCGGNGIDIGFEYEKRWPKLQMVLLPENNRFVNNLVSNCKGDAMTIAVQDKNQPLDKFTFKPNIFQGNIIWGSGASGFPTTEGISTLNPKLVFSKDGLYRPDKKSPIVNFGANSEVTTDMDGQLRDEKKDVGADELSDGGVIYHPLSSKEVGPKWMIQKKSKSK